MELTELHSIVRRRIIMVYGLMQYYNDELTGWDRAVEFHKEESRDLVRRIGVVLDKPIISSAHQKTSGDFMDQIMVQHQVFDHIANQIASQRQRLGRTVSIPGQPIDHPFCHQQDALRARMQTTERTFIRTKYSCSIFLSSFLSD